VEVATIESVRRGERRTTIPERLRSALTARGWVKRPEPRVRFGQPGLPGVGAFGPDDRAGALRLVARAERLRRGEVSHLGYTVPFDVDHPDWFPAGTPPAWQAALHGLDEVLALAIAASTAEAGTRRPWYELAMQVVRAWNAAVPERHAIAWTVPALARRVRNLLLAQGIFTVELRSDQAMRRDLLVSLYDQAGALAGAVGSAPADPWLVAAGNSLFLAGRFFDGMEARTWVETGTTILWGQLREQVREDGGHESRSPVWQAFLLAEYVATLAVLRADNDDVPVWGRKRVKGMADCLAWLAHPDGTLATFDPATVDDVWEVPELLAAAAAVLHEPAFAVTDELPGGWPLLVVGDAGRRTYRSLARSRGTSGARALRRTGFFVLGGDHGDAMIVDGAARARTDGVAAFDYELSVGGAPMVIGSPVASEAPGALAAHVRTARARNVLLPSADRPGEPAAAEAKLTVRDGVQYFLGTCQAPAGFGPDVVQRRRIFHLPGCFWLVCDELVGAGTFSGESLVHFHPAVAVRAACAGRPVLHLDRGSGTETTLLVAGVKSLGLLGGLAGAVPQGWFADGDGGWRPAPTAVLRVAGALPLVIGYALVPAGTATPGAFTVQGDAFELRASIVLGDVAYDLTSVQDEVELVTRPV
jgi:hypothetical protein